MNHDAAEPAEQKRRKTHLAVKCFAVGAVIIIVGDLVAMLPPALRTARARQVERAVEFACLLLADYHDTKATWPESWEDLHQIDEGRSWNGNTWPDDEDELRNRVTIDFDKLPHNAAKAVTPIGDCFDYEDRPGYLRLKSLSESPNDLEPEPNDLSAEAVQP